MRWVKKTLQSIEKFRYLMFNKITNKIRKRRLL